MNKYELTGDTRLHHYLHKGEKRQVRLRQIRAIRHFGEVKSGQTGGWVESEDSLSQQGNCWIYDTDSLVYGDSRVEDDAQVRGASTLCHQARIFEQALVADSFISGECHLYGTSRVTEGCQVIALRGLTADQYKILQIFGNATVSASRVVHQAQIYGEASVSHAFIEHRAEVFGCAVVEGNEENNVWICDCARVFDNARLIAGNGEDQIPTLRYSSQVYGNAVIKGDCVLKHQVQVFGNATLIGGPVLPDNHVRIYGSARITGNVLIENNVQIYDNAAIDGLEGEMIHLRGMKDINGEQRVSRSPFYGVF